MRRTPGGQRARMPTRVHSPRSPKSARMSASRSATLIRSTRPAFSVLFSLFERGEEFRAGGFRHDRAYPHRWSPARSPCRREARASAGLVLASPLSCAQYTTPRPKSNLGEPEGACAARRKTDIRRNPDASVSSGSARLEGFAGIFAAQPADDLAQVEVGHSRLRVRAAAVAAARAASRDNRRISSASASRSLRRRRSPRGRRSRKEAIVLAEETPTAGRDDRLVAFVGEAHREHRRTLRKHGRVEFGRALRDDAERDAVFAPFLGDAADRPAGRPERLRRSTGM